MSRLVSILQLILGCGYKVGRYSEAKLGRILKIKLQSRCWCLVEILKLMLCLVYVLKMKWKDHSIFGSVHFAISNILDHSNLFLKWE